MKIWDPNYYIKPGILLKLQRQADKIPPLLFDEREVKLLVLFEIKSIKRNL